MDTAAPPAIRGHTEDVVAALTPHVLGEIITAADPSYDKARAVYNAMIDRRPAVIVRCRDAADVVSSTRIRMLNGQSTSVSAANGSYYINNAKILVTDVFASNGVIHAIDHVLLPA